MLSIKKGGLFNFFFCFRKAFYSKVSKSIQNCCEYNASLLENSHLESILCADLLRDQMRAGSWQEALKLLGFGVFILSEGLFALDVFSVNKKGFFFTLLGHKKSEC